MGGAGAGLAQDKTFVRIGTASSGGNTYRIGAGLASLFNEKLDGVQASVQATKGSTQNMDLLADGEIEVATAGGSVVVEAVANEGQWAEREKGSYEDIQFITTLYPNPVWFVAM
jgi:TRAP transporter TAXI family solute receptor